jgi:protein TonB
MILRPVSPPHDLPEWWRSARFFLLALMLHVAILFYPLKIAIDQLDVLPSHIVQVRLQEPRTPIPPSPVQSVVPVRQDKPQTRAKKQITTPRPVLAMPAEPASQSTDFTVPVAVVPNPPALPSPSVAATPAPVAVVSAARFNVAYLNNPEPKYPSLSRRLGEQGKVLLRVKVTAEGLPVAVDLEKSSNFERLDEAACQVVARWRFIPAKRGDEAIEATVIVPIVFRLDD